MNIINIDRQQIPKIEIILDNTEIKLQKSPRFIIIDNDNILYNDIYYIKYKHYTNTFNTYKNFDIIIDNNIEYLYFENYLYVRNNLFI